MRKGERMKLKRYKKTIDKSTVTFTIEFEKEPIDEDQATRFAIAAILEATGIQPMDFVRPDRKPKVEI
jgi:hypothetical protein